MHNLRKILKENALIIVLSILSPFILSPIVMAATTGNVAATVTVTNISLSVANGSFSYGTLSTSATVNTTAGAGGVTPTITTPVITNNGNVAETFNVKGNNTTSAGAVWTLAGTPGSEIYAHSTCKATCDTTPTWTALTASYASLATNIAVSGTVEMDLEIKTPTSTTAFETQTANVDVQAVAY